MAGRLLPACAGVLEARAIEPEGVTGVERAAFMVGRRRGWLSGHAAYAGGELGHCPCGTVPVESERAVHWRIMPAQFRRDAEL